jgi:anti-anti-sigma factor
MIEASQFDVHSSTEGEDARLTLTGELDIATAPTLDGAVQAALTGGARRVVIELGGLTFVDSSGLRLLIMLSQRAPEEGWKLELTRPSDSAMSVFRMTGAEENLPFVEEPPAT